MTVLLSTIALGLVLALVGYGVYLSFRVLQFPDLTVDGSFTLGAATAAALMLAGWDPFTATAIAALAGALAGLDSGLDRVVRLHVCAATDEAAAAALPLLEAALPAGHRPAITCVVGGLPSPGCLVALDAVAASRKAVREVTGTAAGRILPPGTRIFVSGQAKEADSLAEATRRTLEGLGATLDFLGRPRADVVQYKAFVAPAAEAEVVRREIAAFHAAGPVPPVVVVEWKSAARLPVEIELVAWGGPATAPAGPEFLTPPDMTASPIYCRVVRVAAPRTIYVGGLAAARDGDAADRETAEREVNAVLGRLGEVLADAGSDLRHLVKATYYVSTDATSAALNAVRRKAYDPARPPAASKALVPGVGRPESGMVLDMIAVPTVPGSR